MQPEVFEPLAPGEEVLRVRVEISAQIASGCSQAQIRANVLQTLYGYAEQYGYDVVRGPEIASIHRAQYPGDESVMVAIGIGVARVR